MTGVFVGSDEVVCGFRVKQHPIVTRTAGIGILIGPKEVASQVYEVGTAHVVNRATIRQIKSDGQWEGFQHGLAWDVEIYKYESRYFRHNGFVHDAVIPNGGSRIPRYSSSRRD